MAIIELNNVSMIFKIHYNDPKSIKERFIMKAKKQYSYTNFTALDNITFSVEKGEILGIIGSNGAGKSTLLKVISRLLPPTTGCIKVNGSIAPMIELGLGFDYELTGIENIMLSGALLGFSKNFIISKLDEIIDFSELNEFIYAPIRTYSSGMITRLAFSISTVIEPEILIVDEVLSVGDESFQKKSKEKMIQLMNSGATVLFVSHSTALVRELCDKVIWLDHGKILRYGNTEDICNDYTLNIK